MKNKGNQKHLTFEQRVDIEKGLTENKSFAEIGRTIGEKHKDATENEMADIIYQEIYSTTTQFTWLHE